MIGSVKILGYFPLHLAVFNCIVKISFRNSDAVFNFELTQYSQVINQRGKPKRNYLTRPVSIMGHPTIA